MLAFFKQLWVDLDEDFESVVDHAMNSSAKSKFNRMVLAPNRVTNLFQCVLEFVYRTGNTNGRITPMLSLIKFTMYSLFQ